METQAVQKWYTKPQVIAIGATAGYLLLNKKTRKPTLTVAGAYLLLQGINDYRSGDGMGKAFAQVTVPVGAALLWYGLRKKK